MAGRRRASGWRELHVWVGNSSLLDGRAWREGLPIGSQVGQADLVADLWHGLRGGFFVDLAANDAAHLSNTLLLEERYGWHGICIEANPRFMWDLARRRCSVVYAVAADRDNASVSFALRPDTPGLGGVVAPGTDNEATRGGAAEVTRLPTVGLERILSDLRAPRRVHYLSLDIEGAELSAISGLSGRFTFLTLTVERPSGELQALLTQRGMVYVRLTSEFGDVLYVHRSMPRIRFAMRRHRDLARDEREFGYVPDAAFVSLPPPLAKWQQVGALQRSRASNLELCAARWRAELDKSNNASASILQTEPRL